MEAPIPWENAYIKNYVVDASTDDIRALLGSHFEFAANFLKNLPEARAGFAYADGKWTIRQVLGHIADSHAIFTYRAMCIGRGEKKTLPGFEENDYAQRWGGDETALRDLVQLYALQFRATLAQASLMRKEDWERSGVANGIALTPLVIFRALIGHERHHLRVLGERYGVNASSAV